MLLPNTMSEAHTDLFAEQRKNLDTEITLVQKAIDKFDDLIFKIKSFAVTISLALLGFAVKERIPVMALLGAVAAVMFWIQESVFKSFQRGYIYRMNRITRFLHSEDFAHAVRARDFGGFRTPDLNNHYFGTEREKRKTGFWRSALLMNVCITYILLSTLSIVVYLFIR